MNQPSSHLTVSEEEVATIDASVRGPVLTCFSSAILWLLLSSAFSLMAYLKLHAPQFLNETAYLTYGRVQAAASTLFLYGWAPLSGLGVIYWITGRLSGASFDTKGLAILGIVFWNLALLWNLGEILVGATAGLSGMEFSSSTTGLLFLGYSLTAMTVIRFIQRRKEAALFISTAYMIAALFAFPWIFGTLYVVLGASFKAGVFVAGIQAWFASNLLGLWLTPLALAALYYLIPIMTGKPIYNRGLARFGFWSLILFQSWTGFERLAGGPIPAWLVTVGIVARVLLVLPILAAVTNLTLTQWSASVSPRAHVALRFMQVGLVAYALSGFGNAIFAFRSLQSYFQFTPLLAAQEMLVTYGFFSFVMFGAIYWIVPLVSASEGPSLELAQAHFWLGFLGLIFAVGALAYAGVIQAYSLPQAETSYLSLLSPLKTALWVRSLAWVSIITGHLVFATLYLLSYLKLTPASST
jgi:cytochrome c oxidase cbb3-type subunit 1